MIYSAVQDPKLWTGILDRIDEVTGSEQTLLFAALSNPTIPDALYSAGTDDEFVATFLNHYAAINVLAEPCDRMFPTGEVRYSHWALPDSEFEHSEFYCDFFRPRQMHYSFGLKVPVDGRPEAYLSCQRPKSKGPFSEREGVVFQTLFPHLKRALTLHTQFSQMQSGLQAFGTALDSYEHMVFGLDATIRVVVTNKHADQFMLTADGLGMAHGRLSATFPAQDRDLQKILAQSVATGSGSGITSGNSILLHRKSGKKPLRVTVTPFTTPLPGTSAQVAALVFVSDPQSATQPRGAILRALYALTPTETRVADLLLEGLEARETAATLGLSLEGARFHIKRVMAKTSTRRQSELIRLMLSLPRI
jgi:DNA-binding CsgD family transcriptional regulator